MRLDITPDPGFFGVFPNLNYKAWYAVAEFVDNSIQSYEDNKVDLLKTSEAFQLVIRIATHDGATLTVTDNAGGIKLSDFDRAFRVAAVPPNRQGLSEFGMGMKTAACWFAPVWSVRTSALGDPCERTVTFDIPEIIKHGFRNLDVAERTYKADAHYTEVTLRNLYHPPIGQTKAKIKQHLACMYRKYIEKGEVVIKFDEEPLEYRVPPILVAPYYKEPGAEPIEWLKNLDFEFNLENGTTMRARGFLAIREKMTNTTAGLSLFRRNRLIVGSMDDLYRPGSFLGAANESAARRIFGDIELDPVTVTHTKDGFVQWAEIEQAFLVKLREEADAGEMKLRQQAANYKVPPPPALPSDPDPFDPVTEVVKPIAEGAVRGLDGPGTRDALVNHGAGVEDDVLPCPLESTISPRWQQATQRFQIKFENVTWHVRLEFSDDIALADWVQITHYPSAGKDRELGIRLAMDHPFTLGFGGPNYEDLAPQVRLAIGLCLAECAARDAGTENAGKVRSCLNDLLRGPLGEANENGGLEFV